MAKATSTVLVHAGGLRPHAKFIENAFDAALKLLPKDFITHDIDVVFQDLADWTIPESHIVGHTYSPTIINISLDGKQLATREDIIKTVVHELHHAVRWQTLSLSRTLGDAVVSEGLACLFEQELCGGTPIYAQANYKKPEATQLKDNLEATNYDRNKWFYGGDPKVQRWLGYAYGFDVCATYAQEHKTTAASLVAVPTNKILGL